jgi:hypothetical protein
MPQRNNWQKSQQFQGFNVAEMPRARGKKTSL